MRRLIITCNQWDVVVVPFPFVDVPKAKHRPTLVLSVSDFNQYGLVTLTMITTVKSRQHTRDYAITDLDTTGLTRPSLIRWKIFTLDSQIIKWKIGHLALIDQTKCQKLLKSIFQL